MEQEQVAPTPMVVLGARVPATLAERIRQAAMTRTIAERRHVPVAELVRAALEAAFFQTEGSKDGF